MAVMWVGLTFNSTRYIRNESQHNKEQIHSLLSTPHGTLGTRKVIYVDRETHEKLSTPHGTLGTEITTSL